LVRTGHDCALHLLPWSTVTPPPELLNLIFPGVERVLARVLAEKKKVVYT